MLRIYQQSTLSTLRTQHITLSHHSSKASRPNKIGQILCLGNLTDKETYDFLRGIASDLQIVKGDFDVEAPNLALSKVVTHGSYELALHTGIQ